MNTPFAPALLGLLLFVTRPAPAEVPVYETAFEADGHGLVTWGVSPEGFAAHQAQVNVTPQAAPETGNVLEIEVLPDPAPLRIAQKEKLFRLQPEANYELRAKLRLPDIGLQRGGRFSIIVTDAKWTWSSPPIALNATNPDWKTYSIPFKAPALEDARYRVRIQVLHARAKVEIAAISVVNVD